jgi:phosphoglucosamine mutase
MQKFPQITVNIEVKEKPDLETIPEIKKAISDAENKLGERGRVLVRYSGTQLLCRVMAEAPTKEETEEIANGIARVIKERIAA